MKKVLLLSIIVCCIVSVKAQAPQGINYQAVARDANGTTLDGTDGTIQITILDAVNGNALYTETHNVTTNQFGLFTLVIGQGTPVSGAFSNINWGNSSRYLNVKTDFGNGLEDMGTTQLLSVPYALYAEKSGDGPPGKNSLAEVSSTTTNCPNGGYTITVGTDDDGNGTLTGTEISQSFELCNGANGSSTLVAGQGIAIDYLTNTVSNIGDLDSTDDIITSTALVGNTIQIVEGGITHTIDISSLMGDTSSINELQTISISGNTVQLSGNGSSIQLSATAPNSGDILTWNGSAWEAQPLPANTDNQNLSNGGKAGNMQTINIQNGTGVTFSVADGDSSSTNEIQSIAYTAATQNLALSGSNSVTLDVNDADADPANEYNTSFSVVGTDLTLTDGGGTLTVPLSSISAPTYWDTVAGTSIFNTNSGNVGIGPMISTGPGYFTPTGKALTIATNNAYVATDPASLELVGVASSGTLGRIAFGRINSGLSAVYVGGIDMQASTSMLFYTNGNNERMRIAANGNVGINETNPEAYLHVVKTNGAITPPALTLGNSNQPNWEWQFDIDGTSKMFLKNEGNGSSFTVMTFDNNNGNVGIGPMISTGPGYFAPTGKALTIATTNAYTTTSPASLELVGSSATSYDIMGKIAFGYIVPGSSANYLGGIEMDKIGNMLFYTNGNNERMRINSNGKVGIGTITPATSLDVNGTITISDTIGEVNHTNTGTANLIPIAYGNVDTSTATVNAGTGNFTVNRVASGQYLINVSGYSLSVSNCIISINTQNSNPRFVGYGDNGSGGIYVYIRNISGSFIDNNFSFIIYKP